MEFREADDPNTSVDLRTQARVAPLVKLPTDAGDRKRLPIFTGVLMYFPNAWAAVATVSRIGNEQHNPGEPLHWARGKSTDQMDTATRHMMDHGMGNSRDTDGTYHLAKAIWRLAAELQLTIEHDAMLEEERAKYEGSLRSRAVSGSEQLGCRTEHPQGRDAGVGSVEAGCSVPVPSREYAFLPGSGRR